MSTPDPRFRPLKVPHELEAAYREDLNTWKDMVYRWPDTPGDHQVVNWRDEQSFKRAWLVSRNRAEIETLSKVTADLDEALHGFAWGGRHVRARWAVTWLRDRLRVLIGGS